MVWDVLVWTCYCLVLIVLVYEYFGCFVVMAFGFLCGVGCIGALVVVLLCKFV